MVCVENTATGETKNMLIDLEDESDAVTNNTLRKFEKYKTFGSFVYGVPMFTGVICKKDPANFPKELKITKTDILRPPYIHFTDDELLKKYENLINKVKHNIELTEIEALDFVFIPKYLTKENASKITESIAELFPNAKINDVELKRDISIILTTLIVNNIPDEDKQNKLLEGIDMKKYKDDMEEFIYSIFGEELEAKDNKIAEQDHKLTEKDNKIAEQDSELEKYKSQVKQLKELEDYNSPEAKKIINALLIQ